MSQIKYKSKFADKKKLLAIVKKSASHNEVLKAYNMNVSGASLKILKNYLTTFNINIDHFAHFQKIKLINKFLNKRKKQNIFCKNSKIDKKTIKKEIIKNNLIPYLCSTLKCPTNESKYWFGIKLTLEMEHINGDRYDNRLENLTFLCPNCHSQTETWRGRKK